MTTPIPLPTLCSRYYLALVRQDELEADRIEERLLPRLRRHRKPVVHNGNVYRVRTFGGRKRVVVDQAGAAAGGSQ